jgi:hypothetical protein
MRTRPDANANGKTYRWILQLKDIFFMFGPFRILQFDNGREFVNDLINSLQSGFPG